jgi:ribosomal-protein-alanine N-acetyltransferase
MRISAASIHRRRIATRRLTLRPTEASDAERAFDIQSDWDVTRMLRLASFPPDLAEIRRWFADHARQWSAGEAYRFAIELGGRLIGVVDIDNVGQEDGVLGYWLEKAAWGQGHAFEAAQAAVGFALCEVGLSALRAGHASDNAASERVLSKLGFHPLDTVQRLSRPRGEMIWQRRYILNAKAAPHPSGNAR